MEPDGAGSNNFHEKDRYLAVNSTVLNYYKKYGRKRDLEQYFSLSTAQSEARDPSGLFWRRMKTQDDSSDSGDKKTESPKEICRISIKCSVPDQSSSSQEDPSTKKAMHEESQSPPIVTDDLEPNISRHSDAESDKSDLNTSQKSIDPGFDTSTNKPLSPTSSITYHRKLEWDSLADVGYGNESHRKNSASSLSTLERMALRQQYSNSDTKLNSIGLPTAESTPLDENKDSKHKTKPSKSYTKTTKIHKKSLDVFKLNIPPSDNAQSVNVNLTKHISFNVDKDTGAITANIHKSPDKVSVDVPKPKLDKEIQTSLTKRTSDTPNPIKPSTSCSNLQQVPVVIHLNSLRRRLRTVKLRTLRNTRRKRRNNVNKKLNLSCQEKSGEQVSEAESFEYMPGHIYNQNQHRQGANKSRSVAGNKSSLESSGGLTTESSKTSVKSFSKDLEKGIEYLNKIIEQHQDDPKLKKKLVRNIITKLINTKYKGDDTIDFQSGLTFSSILELAQGNYTTTSTSDMNICDTAPKHVRPKKSILRTQKFDSTAVATTQSVPNLNLASTSEINLSSKREFSLQNSETEGSSKNRYSSDSILTTSEELYKKYVVARKREQLYKRQLLEKDMLLRKKLVGSDAIKSTKHKSTVNELVKDLVYNNFDCGDTNGFHERDNYHDQDFTRRTRSHSVFTLSSGNSNKKPFNEMKQRELRQKIQQELESENNPVASTSRNTQNCCCQCHTTKIGVTDSAVQVDVSCPKQDKQTIKSNFNKVNIQKVSGELLTNNLTGELKYVCFCTNGCGLSHEVPDNFLIYKCSRLNDNATQLDTKCNNKLLRDSDKQSSEKSLNINKDFAVNSRKSSRSSQTNINVAFKAQDKASEYSVSSSTSKENMTKNNTKCNFNNKCTTNICACIQTDISINPKLSDPSLSDVNIIEDKHNIIQQASTSKVSCDERKSNSDESINSRKDAKIKDHINTKEVECQANFDFDDVSNIDVGPYTIPLRGTNIELTVDFNDRLKHTKDFVKEKQVTNQGVITEQKYYSEKATSLDDDTTNFKPVALKIKSSSSDTDIKQSSTKSRDKTKFYSTTTSPRNRNINIKNDYCKTQNSPIPRQQTLTKPIESKDLTKNPMKLSFAPSSQYPKNLPKYHTYPAQTVNPEKPFTRRNTDSNITSHSLEKINDFNMPDEAYREQIIVEPISKEIDKLHEELPSTSRKSSTGISNASNTSDKEIHKDKPNSRHSKTESDNSIKTTSSGDPIMNMIKDITRRYTKRDTEKYNKRKCVKEIMTVLNYLVDTDDSGERQFRTEESSSSYDAQDKNSCNTKSSLPKQLVDKGVQPDNNNKHDEKVVESSDNVGSSDIPRTSTDSQASKILEKIQKQCEKYHQRRSQKSVKDKPCETSSSFSGVCDKCKKEHQGSCKVSHKCKNHRTKSTTEKAKKQCVAYNLIIQTSDSFVSEETILDKNRQPLRNIIVKVPSRRKNIDSRHTDDRNPTIDINAKTHRSRSLPNDSDLSSAEDAFKRAQEFTVRQYLEKNRPDFVTKTTKRQDCLKTISETRTNEYRKLLSLRLAHQPDVSHVSLTDLRKLANHLGLDLKKKNPAPKFMSEKEMKKHSEKIYKTLPEVVQKKEEMRKKRIKRTNLIMASLFNKNLQKKTLSGAVNLSNYSTVIKI